MNVDDKLPIASRRGWLSLVWLRELDCCELVRVQMVAKSLTKRWLNDVCDGGDFVPVSVRLLEDRIDGFTRFRSSLEIGFQPIEVFRLYRAWR